MFKTSINALNVYLRRNKNKNKIQRIKNIKASNGFVMPTRIKISIIESTCLLQHLKILIPMQRKFSNSNKTVRTIMKSSKHLELD